MKDGAGMYVTATCQDQNVSQHKDFIERIAEVIVTELCNDSTGRAQPRFVTTEACKTAFTSSYLSQQGGTEQIASQTGREACFAISYKMWILPYLI